MRFFVKGISIAVLHLSAVFELLANDQAFQGYRIANTEVFSGFSATWFIGENPVRMFIPSFGITITFLAVMGIPLLLFMFFISYFHRRRYLIVKKELEKEVMETIRTERLKLRTLIDSIPDIIYIKDRESRFLVTNKRTAQVMGTTPEDIAGKTDFDFFPEDLARVFYEDEQKIMESGQTLIGYEAPGLDEMGNRIIVSTTKVPLTDHDGKIIGLAGVGRDITRIKRAEIQLRRKTEDLQEINRLLEERQEEILMQSEELAAQAQDLRAINTELERLNLTKDKFFSIIAHDLRNPFNAILGLSELLRKDFYEMDNEQKLELLEMINISCETAYDLLENLLQWARAQTNKINFVPEAFNIVETIESAIKLHSLSAEKKRIELRQRIPDSLMVHADRNMINTVVRNLISNAIKFSTNGTEVLITSAVQDGMVEISIQDQGIGIAKENLGKLFRIDSYHSTTGTSGETGTGLGLLICKEFVEKNKGKIRAESKPGSGTRVSFTLAHASEKNL
jgi:PAS domain S-box-containing protein